MCGFAGIVVDPGQDDGLNDDRAFNSIAYRGPDSLVRWTDGQTTLYHSRLSIIDYEGGGQPMEDPESHLVIVFNGAIYNYIELRQRYEDAGARFTTKSDTEVILKGFRLFGPQVVNHLMGMFAFAIWDKRNKSLFLARDRLGKKPLFWARTGKSFIFASTLSAFRAHPDWSSKLSIPGLCMFLTLGGFPRRHTAFQNTYTIPPSCYSIYHSGDSDISSTKYWDLQFSSGSKRSEGELLEEYEAILTDAVRIRLRSDAPVGISFSGGTDSGTIGAIARRLGTNIKCFTIDYDSPDSPSPEVRLSREISSQLGIDWHFINYDYKKDLIPDIWSAYKYFDQPCQQVALSYSYRLYKEMKKHCRVVLSGNGADELFSGYSGQAKQRLFDVYRNLLRGIPPGIFSCLPPRQRSAINCYRLNGLSVPQSELINIMAYARQYTSDPIALDVCRQVAEEVSCEYEEAGVDSIMDLVMYRTLATAHVDANFRLPDITGYAAHVEVRSPFLDHRMVEFAARLPHQYKVGRFWLRLREKYLPRRYYAKLVGERAGWHPKMGMGYNLNWPVDFALNDAYQPWVQSAFSAIQEAGINVRPFERAHRDFVRCMTADRTPGINGGTAVIGIMLGAWLLQNGGDSN